MLDAILLYVATVAVCL